VNHEEAGPGSGAAKLGLADSENLDVDRGTTTAKHIDSSPNQQAPRIPGIHLHGSTVKVLHQASKTAQVGFLSKDSDPNEQKAISNNLNKSIYYFAEN